MNQILSIEILCGWIIWYKNKNGELFSQNSDEAVACESSSPYLLSSISIAMNSDFVNSHSSIPENHFATTGDHIGSPLRDEGRTRRRDGRPRPSEKEKWEVAKKNPSMIPSLWDTSPFRGNQIRVHMQYSTRT